MRNKFQTLLRFVDATVLSDVCRKASVEKGYEYVCRSVDHALRLLLGLATLRSTKFLAKDTYQCLSKEH